MRPTFMDHGQGMIEISDCRSPANLRIPYRIV